MIERISQSVEQTQAVAAELATRLSPGTVIALEGPLGAGKTQFVRGLVIALGGNGRSVSSPTYVLLHVYDTARPVVFHLDAYRVHGPDDFEGIGFEELLDEGGITVVEWPGRVSALLPHDAIHVKLEVTGEQTRRILVCGSDESDASSRSPGTLGEVG